MLAALDNNSFKRSRNGFCILRIAVCTEDVTEECILRTISNERNFDGSKRITSRKRAVSYALDFCVRSELNRFKSHIGKSVRKNVLDTCGNYQLNGASGISYKCFV